MVGKCRIVASENMKIIPFVSKKSEKQNLGIIATFIITRNYFKK